MSEMVERLKQAIVYVQEGPCVPESVVRDVLEAMREPTSQIISQLDELLETQGHHQTIEQSWRLLIDASLK